MLADDALNGGEVQIFGEHRRVCHRWLLRRHG